MRMKARVDLVYAGQSYQAGDLFDTATQKEGLDLRNRDRAIPFNLEDPAFRRDEDLRDEDLPETLPDVPPVTLTPTEATAAAAGGSDSFHVTMTGPGVSGTWTVDKDAVADWLTLDSPTRPQSADGDVNYTVDANIDVERSANFYVNGKTFTVTQSAGTRRRR